MVGLVSMLGGNAGAQGEAPAGPSASPAQPGAPAAPGPTAQPTPAPTPAPTPPPVAGSTPAAPAPQLHAPAEPPGVAAAPLEPAFTVLQAPMGEAPPLPFPVVLSLGPVLSPRIGVGDFSLEPHLRTRLRAAWVQPDPNLFFIGRNSGFNLAEVRVGLTGGYRKVVRFNLSIEAATDTRSGQNQLVGELSTRLRDASFTFAPWEFLQFTAGQFRPPSDRESLYGIDASPGAARTGTPQLLPTLSVANRGVQAGEGLQIRGMDPGRDLGVMVHGDVRPLRFLGATYAVALVNGNGQNQVLNDNNDGQVWTRLTGGVRDLPVLSILEVGAQVHYGKTTALGALPSVFHDQVLGGAVDAVGQVFGLQLWGQVMWQQTKHLTTLAATELSTGGFLQLAYRDLFGFSPVARLGYYQFSSALPQFNVAELSLGMRYDIPNLPLTTFVGYTHPEETGWGIYDLGEENTTRHSRVPSQARIPGQLRNRLTINNWAPDERDGFPISNERVEASFQLSF